MPLPRPVLVEIIGETATRSLEDRGFRVVDGCEASMLREVSSWQEVAAASLEAIANLERDEPQEMRCLAQGALHRMTSSDRATPFADQRLRIGRLEDERALLRQAITSMIAAVSSPTLRECIEFGKEHGYGVGEIEKSDLESSIKRAKKLL